MMLDMLYSIIYVHIIYYFTNLVWCKNDPSIH